MIMRKLTITNPARSDLIDIRTYTVKHYGHRAADSYDTLLKQAIRDVREDPYRLGSKRRPEISKNICSYHTMLSRTRAGRTVKNPRHFILYFLPNENEVVISRVLHDSRDIVRHVPQEHLEQPQEIIHKKPDEKES